MNTLNHITAEDPQAQQDRAPMAQYDAIDQAASEGYNAHFSSAKIPLWVLKEQVFIDARSIGKRQAKDINTKGTHARH